MSMLTVVHAATVVYYYAAYCDSNTCDNTVYAIVVLYGDDATLVHAVTVILAA